jgi:hypothetical protein
MGRRCHASSLGFVRRLLSASQHDSQHALLLEPVALSALEYAATHDFENPFVALAAPAAGALVELLGRKEGGKTLGRQTVFAVVDALSWQFQDGHYTSQRPLTFIFSTLKRVAVMAVSDANCSLMLQHKALVGTLVKALLLDSPRRSEPGGDAMQEASAFLYDTLV